MKAAASTSSFWPLCSPVFGASPQGSRWLAHCRPAGSSSRKDFQFSAIVANVAAFQEAGMPIYELDGRVPEFPGEGQYWVADNATLIGRVRLKRQASAWVGAVLRGDNEWGELV